MRKISVTSDGGIKTKDYTAAGWLLKHAARAGGGDAEDAYQDALVDMLAEGAPATAAQAVTRMRWRSQNNGRAERRYGRRVVTDSDIAPEIDGVLLDDAGFYAISAPENDLELGNPEAIIEHRQAQAERSAMLAGLSARARETIKLISAGYQYPEVAAILGVSSDVVTQIVSREIRRPLGITR